MKDLETTVRIHPFFQGMKASHLALLCKGATEMRFDKNAVLFNQGQPANRFFLIEQGTVALEAHDPCGCASFVQVLGKGEAFGWSWLFQPFTWNLTARANEPVTAIAFDGAHLLACAEENHEFGYDLMKRVSQVLIHRLQATRNRLIEAEKAELVPVS
jgi:CRP/FNR family transcriptional regulator, cyclic AMP receptor protein